MSGARLIDADALLRRLRAKRGAEKRSARKATYDHDRSLRFARILMIRECEIIVEEQVAKSAPPAAEGD